jgi:hypothetical protein
MNGHEFKDSCVIYFQSEKIGCLLQLLILMPDSLIFVKSRKGFCFFFACFDYKWVSVFACINLYELKNNLSYNEYTSKMNQPNIMSQNG